MQTKTHALTPRRARFVAEFLVSGNGAEAARRAGYAASSASVTGTRLLADAKVSGAIRARQQQDAERLHVDRQRVLEGLLEAYGMAKAQMNPAAMVAATREIAKLLGLYAPKQMRVELDAGQKAEMGRYEAMSDAELSALMRSDPEAGLGAE